ncbi:hypothetical protein ACH5A7_37935 [Streptomyces sp. NPDC018955]|uniref:hypothetical protein n=1 Tax=Streptomyces sp. NPDC018955 TaxID=3365055 RepID=UPI0037BC68EE
MDTGAELVSPVWLLMGATGSAPGFLYLKKQRVAFEVTRRGALTEGQSNRLMGLFHDPGLNGTWSPEGTPVVFDVPLSEVTGVRFPWYEFGGGMRIHLGSHRFRFSFVQPSNTAVEPHAPGMGRGRAACRHWKDALSRL